MMTTTSNMDDEINNRNLSAGERETGGDQRLELLEQEAARARDALLLTNERYLALTAAISQMVLITLPDGRIAAEMPAWQAFTGQSADEILDWGWTAALDPDDLLLLPKEWERAIAGKSVAEARCRIRRHDGAMRDFRLRGAAVLDRPDEIKEWVIVCEDVTDQRVREARHDAILKSAPDGIITMGSDGKIIDINPAAELMFGRRSEEVLGQELAEVMVPPALRDRHRKGVAARTAASPEQTVLRYSELPAMRSDGSEIPVEISVVQIPSEGETAFIGFVRDVSDRKEAETDLKYIIGRSRCLPWHVLVQEYASRGTYLSRSPRVHTAVASLTGSD
ncbi:MAG: PAS domain S-box protein [Chloroflexi bacterium]|nr:PAS domain S-box protein [Chloroflexota bacterium]